MDKSEFVEITCRDDLSKYEINMLGQLRNIDSDRVQKGHISRDGYLQYCVELDNGKRTTLRAHTLVAYQFIPRVEGKTYINHIDEDKTNNDVDNLEWCTAKENLNHGTCQERRSRNRMRPVNEYDLDGHYIRTWKSAGSVSEFYANVMGIKRQMTDSIWHCCKGENKMAFNRVWRYYDGDTNDIVLRGSDLPMRDYRRCDWSDFKDLQNVPEEYLYSPNSKGEILDYFMSSSKLSAVEKTMLREALCS